MSMNLSPIVNLIVFLQTQIRRSVKNFHPRIINYLSSYDKFDYNFFLKANFYQREELVECLDSERMNFIKHQTERKHGDQLAYAQEIGYYLEDFYEKAMEIHHELAEQAGIFDEDTASDQNYENQVEIIPPSWSSSGATTIPINNGDNTAKTIPGI